MPVAVVGTAMLTCSFGMAPASILPTPNTVMIGGKPSATIMDFATGANIPPFGMCSSLVNPTVAAATAAAFGVLTPMPCTPVPVAPWTPMAPRTLIGGKPALATGAQCFCAYAGVIAVTQPAQFTTMVN